MKLDRIAVVCLVLGACLVVLSMCLEHFILPALPANATWSREEAEALVAASMDYHAKSFDTSVSEEDLAASAAEYKAHEEKLNAVKAGRANLPRFIKYAGYTTAAVGIACYVAAKARSDS